MTVIPIRYSLRSLRLRVGATIMTVLGLALALCIFLFVRALLSGLQETFISTGNPLNVLVMRQGSDAEIESNVQKEAVDTLRSLPGVANGSDGQPLVSGETVFGVLLPRADRSGEVNATVRGLSRQGIAMRNGVHLAEGRWFQPGKREISISSMVRKRFAHCQLGETISFNQGTWTIVGIFEGSHSAYDSEIWADVNQVNSDFQQTDVSSAWLRATDSAAAAGLIARIRTDRRLGLDGQSETGYFAKQTESGQIIGLIGTIVAIIMAVGACFGAMNTMYGSVSYRSREIGTLRTIGFSRGSILLAFLVESVLLALVACAIGLLCMLPLDGMTTGTRNLVTFSETVFSLRLNSVVALQGIACCLCMGVLGGLAPAWRAARQDIVRSLRT